jgi:Skp family chaperone for outer membrane proteins
LKVKINKSAPLGLKNSTEPSAAVVAAARAIDEAPRYNNSQPNHHIADQNHINNNLNNYTRSQNDNGNDQQEPTNLKHKSKRSHRNRKGDERREQEISSNHDLDDDVYHKNLSNNSRQHRAKPLNDNENSDKKKVGRKISKFTQTRITGLEGQLQRIEDMLKQDLSNTSLSYEMSGGGGDLNEIKRDYYRDDSRRMMMVGGAHQDEGNNYNMTNVEKMRRNMNDEDFLEDETEYKVNAYF